MSTLRGGSITMTSPPAMPQRQNFRNLPVHHGALLHAWRAHWLRRDPARPRRLHGRLHFWLRHWPDQRHPAHVRLQATFRNMWQPCRCRYLPVYCCTRRPHCFSPLYRDPSRCTPWCSYCGLSWQEIRHGRRVRPLHRWGHHSDHSYQRMATVCCWPFGQRSCSWCTLCGRSYGRPSETILSTSHAHPRCQYQAETAPSRIRGTLTATYQLFITFGILVAYCISIGTRNMAAAGSWRTVVGVGIIWPFIMATGILFMPESPRWLAVRGRIDKARQSLARSHGIPSSEEHTNEFLNSRVEDVHSNVEYGRHLRGGWLDCFRPTNKILYRTLLGMALQSFQQLTGANYFFYYGATIFTSVGISDSFITQIIFGAVNFVCTFGGLYVMQRFGRRNPLIIGGIWQSCWLVVFAIAGTAKIPQQNPNIGKLMIVSACMFILGYAVTWAPGVWILIGETFPTRTRAKQGALSTAANWLWNFLLAFFTPFIINAIEFRYGFVFAVCNLAGAVIVYFFLYESSDLSLESVDHMYNDPNCTPWTSCNWAPPGYASRYDLVQQTKAADANNPVAGTPEEGGIKKAVDSSTSLTTATTMGSQGRRTPLV